MKQRPNRSLVATALAACLGLSGSLVSIGASAQQPGTGASSAAATANASQPMRDARASKLIGMSVRNAQGDNVGEIKDLVVDVRDGRVRHAVLSSGGFLGLGDRLFAYPMSAFRTSADRDDLVLAVDRERLKEQPGFESSRWPDLREYAGVVDRFFARLGIGDGLDREEYAEQRMEQRENHAAPGVQFGERRMEPFREAARSGVAGNPDLRRASELIGRNVRDTSNRQAGEIEDLVVRLGNGRIHYVVVDFDKAWSPDDKLLALPMSALRFCPRRDQVVLDVPRERRDMARGFDAGLWPDFNDPAWRSASDRATGATSAAGTAAGAAATASGDRASGAAAR